MNKAIAPSRKRPAIKERHITSVLRRQIVAGELPPGSQLPKRTDLEQRFAVSPVTVQRAVDRLIDEGFVYAKTGQGTFVVDSPPHLSRYGFIFPSSPGDAGWTTFYAALSQEIDGLRRADARKYSVYCGLQLAEGHDQLELLTEEIRSHRLAGLIFFFSPRQFEGTPVLTEPGLARVAVMSEPLPGVPAAVLSGAVSRALDFLASRGRRRIAIFDACTQPPRYTESLMAQIAARGMECRSYWRHAVHPIAPEAAQNIADLLGRAAPDERPDALYISDDNLVPHATAGLAAAGVRVPEEMDVVAHANFPRATPSVVPARRIGYDARRVLATCLQCINQQLRDEGGEQVTYVPAEFEEEVRAVSI